MIGNKVEFNREDDDTARTAQIQKSGSLTPITGIINANK